MDLLAPCPFCDSLNVERVVERPDGLEEVRCHDCRASRSMASWADAMKMRY